MQPPRRRSLLWPHPPSSLRRALTTVGKAASWLKIPETSPPGGPCGPHCHNARPWLRAVWHLKDSGLRAHTSASPRLCGLDELSPKPPAASPPQPSPPPWAWWWPSVPHLRRGGWLAPLKTTPSGPQGSSCSLPTCQLGEWHLSSPRRGPEARWGTRRVSVAGPASPSGPGPSPPPATGRSWGLESIKGYHPLLLLGSRAEPTPLGLLRPPPPRALLGGREAHAGQVHRRTAAGPGPCPLPPPPWSAPGEPACALRRDSAAWRRPWLLPQPVPLPVKWVHVGRAVVWGRASCARSAPSPPRCCEVQEWDAAETVPGGGQYRPDRRGPRGREGPHLREHSPHLRGKPREAASCVPSLGPRPAVRCRFRRSLPAWA